VGVFRSRVREVFPNKPKLTQDSVSKFRSSNGWSAGADVSVALVRMVANGTIDTNIASQPVQAFANAGLMADASLERTKVSRLTE
jgi:lipid-binding SYLF domain-containing protein